MSTRARRLRFSAVTATVASIVVFNIAAMFLRDQIPDREPTQLIESPAEYVRKGAVQPVQWRVASPETFAEAKRRDKPIFLVIGSQWSYDARRHDELVFRRSIVANKLNRDFIPVRVDSTWNPEWASAFLPIEALSVHVDPGFQMWLLTPSGDPSALVFDQLENIAVEENSFLAVLDLAYDGWQVASRSGQRTELALNHIAQVRQLRGTTSRSSPSASRYVASVLNRIRGNDGAFAWSDHFILNVNDLRLLWMLGERTALTSAIDRVAKSGAVDWLDGGFYYRATERNWNKALFEKPTALNAEFVALLAQIAAESNDKAIESIAKFGFDYLDALASQESASCPAYRYDKLRMNGRSDRTSFTPEEIRTAFKPVQREQLRRNLGLRVETNPRMIPIFAEVEDMPFHNDLSDSLLQELREIRSDAERTTSPGELLQPTAIAAGRMLAASRLWDDPERRESAREMFQRATTFVVGLDSVHHSRSRRADSEETLADYATFSDAALQKFLLDGDESSLRLGMSVLKRGIEFYTDDRGVLVMTHGIGSSDTLARGLPELLDPMRESTVSRCIRILHDYAALLSDSEPDLADEWMRLARALSGRFASVANGLARGVGSYFCSTARLADGTSIAVVGEGSIELANRLARRHGRRLVAAAGERAFSSLAGSDPGIYLVRSDAARGPMDESELDATLMRQLALP